MPVEGIAVIGGRPGAGKSWALLALAISIATGRPWLGKFATKQGRVLYLDADSPLPTTRSRLSRLLAGRGLDDVSEIQFILEPLCLTQDSDFRRVLQVIRDVQPEVIILDSLVRFHRGDENSSQDMARFSAALKKLIAEFHGLIVLSHHMRKPQKHEGSADMSLRGSTEILAALDTALTLSKGPDGITVEHSKSRASEPVESFIVRLEEPVKGEAVWLEIVGDKAEYVMAQKTEKAGEFLKTALADGQWHSRPDLVALAKSQNVSSRDIDAFLKDHAGMGECEIERDNRPPTSGRGGKTAWYRLATRFPISSTYIDGKSEIGKEGE